MQLPYDLTWLADAPMFIDENLINRFYDAIVKPETQAGTTTLEITEETVRKLEGKLGLEADLTPAGMLGIFKTLFPSIKATGEGTLGHDKTDSSSRTIELHPIHTPQRQLVQLTLHYLVNLPDRTFLVQEPSEQNWRDETNIQQAPRQLVFLDLPGQQEAQRKGLPETKIIPTAAEFEDGHIELLFQSFKDNEGNPPPIYPERGSIEEIINGRKEYWTWFDKNFSATKAMVIVEEAAKIHKKIRWIDYRVPITTEGDTLHLHISPAGNYDTGVLAYNFIKRGFKHGLRLVGTLKSEPDMNILAIYDK